MTDLEFYQKALSCQSWFINKIAEIRAYKKYWSDEFCLREVRDSIEEYYSSDYIKEVFSLNNLTIERAKALRFNKWSENQPDLYLFPLWFTLFLPYGTKVVGIGGNTFKYTEKTDLDKRCGCVAFGVKLKQ